MTEKAFAEVIVSIAHRDVDRTFVYAVPDKLRASIVPGMRVLVPFGRGDKQVEGYVAAFSPSADYPVDRIKPISALQTDAPVINEELLQLAHWMKEKYYTTTAACLKCILPSGIDMKTDYAICLKSGELPRTTGEKQCQVISYLQSNQNVALKSELLNDFGSGVISVIKSLEKKGVLEARQLNTAKNLTLYMKYAFLNHDKEELDEMLEKAETDRSPGAKVLRLLADTNGLSVSDIRSYLHISMSPLKTLEKNGWITIERIEVRRNTVYQVQSCDSSEVFSEPRLTPEQQKAVDKLNDKLNHGDHRPALLHGVTGSGKTEVYIRVIEQVLKRGRQAIVLVPEISLTPQAVQVFIRRFGEQITVTHSRLTLGERYDQWKKARDGEVSIVIGPRSAVFMPFSKLGVIIIDEEHESTYKSETTPKYATKEVALERARLTGALVILGSATPSVESYYQSQVRTQISMQDNSLELITLTRRVNNMPPDIDIADMREELGMGNRSIFSEALRRAMIENIETHKQTILFLNRRGHSTFVSCRSCGHVMTCENCNVNYTFHIHSLSLICHYCGKKIRSPENCPICGSKYIKYFGIGTQKVEKEVQKLFPQATTLRMDMDTTSGKMSHERILNTFRNGDAQILIGTQMIAKGLDFPNVTLVGVMAADLSLNNGDFRAAENTYQLLTQVSGRAGRADSKGRVIIQTYNPEHYSIRYALENRYENFYQHEIAIRRQMLYPPFTHVFSILFSSSGEKKIIVSLYKLLDIMNRSNSDGLFEMLGPAPAVISKIKKQYRWKLIVKSADEEKLKNFVLISVDRLKQETDTTDITMNLTLDPTVLG